MTELESSITDFFSKIPVGGNVGVWCALRKQQNSVLYANYSVGNERNEFCLFFGDNLENFCAQYLADNEDEPTTKTWKCFSSDTLFFQSEDLLSLIQEENRVARETGHTRVRLVFLCPPHVFNGFNTPSWKTFFELLAASEFSLLCLYQVSKRLSKIPVEIFRHNGTIVWPRACELPRFLFPSLKKFKRRRREKFMLALFRVLHDSSKSISQAKRILRLIQRHAAVRGVVLRFKMDSRFSVIDFVGLPSNFSCGNQDFSISRNENGTQETLNPPGFECFCSDVICGRVKLLKGLVTERGAFWTNSMTELLKRFHETELPTPIRGVCQEEGFESVALIPLRMNQETIGLLQFHDPRKNLFSLEKILFFEEIATALAISLQRVQMLRELENSRMDLSKKVAQQTLELEQANQSLEKALSEKNEALKALSFNETRLRAIIEQNPLGIYLSDPKQPWIPEYANPQSVKFLGFTALDLQKNPNIWLESIHPDDRERVKTFKNSYPREADEVQVEYRVILPEGVVWLLDQSLVVSHGPEGRKMIQGFLLDMTSRKIAELEVKTAKERAEAANRAKSIFLASMNHDLRTPLNSILGFTDLLTAQFFGQVNEKQLEYLKFIENSGNQLLTLINDILEITRVDSGFINIEIAPIKPLEIVVEVINSLKWLVEKRGLKTEQRWSGDFPEVKGDRQKIRQVLSIFLKGAIQVSPGGSTVLISMEKLEKSVIFSVQDKGGGISQEHLDSVFSSFVPMDVNAPENSEGMGIGRELCKRLIDLHHGEIGVESQIGAGSRFWFSLPLMERSQISPVGETKTEDKNREVTLSRILIVDDVQSNLTLMASILGISGHEVLIARDGEQAIIQAKRSSPDLVFLDLKLPGMNGGQVLSQIRRIEGLENIPIIAYTASANPETRGKIMKEGFSEVLSKPINSAAVFSLLEKFLPTKNSCDHPRQP